MNASDDDIEVNEKFKETELKEFLSFFWSAMHNVDGPNISPSEIVNREPRESQIPVSFSQGTNWEALAFAQDYSTRRNHVNEEIESLLTHSKYMHARL